MRIFDAPHKFLHVLDTCSISEIKQDGHVSVRPKGPPLCVAEAYAVRQTSDWLLMDSGPYARSAAFARGLARRAARALDKKY